MRLLDTKIQNQLKKVSLKLRALGILVLTLFIISPQAWSATSSNSISISIRIVPDPVFSLGTIIGKVYNDVNQNGAQDRGELGIPNVKLVTDEGTIITTDKHGRYHVPNVISGRHMIKIDKHTLPVGTNIVSDETVLIVARDGLLNKANFAVALPEGLDMSNAESLVDSKKVHLNIQQLYEAPKKKIQIATFSNRQLLNQGLLVPSKTEEDLALDSGHQTLESFMADQVIRIQLNYADFISRWQLQVYDERYEVIFNEEGRSAPPQHFDTSRLNLEEGDYLFVLTVFDENGNQDKLTYDLRARDRISSLASSTESNLSEKEGVSTQIQTVDPSSVNTKPWMGLIEKYKELEIPLHGDVVKFQGEAQPGSTLTIDGREIIVSQDGLFEDEVVLSEGWHVVPVEVHDLDGTVTQYQEMVNISDSYFFLVGMVEYEIGRFTSRGNIDSLSSLERYYRDHTAYADEWASFYLKTKWDSQYVLTASYDNERKQKELYRELEDDDLYPTFGDFSEIEYDAVDTQDELYLKFESNKSYLQWGNFGTGFTGTEFAHFNRTLHGGKVHYETMNQNDKGQANTSFTAYTARARQLAAHIEFRGTGNTLYFLKHKDIVSGSEKIVLEVRDEITNIPIDRIEMKPGMDYRIDYDQGRIIFNKPVHSVSSSNTTITSNSLLDGDPQYIVVDYEYESTTSFREDNMGLRASHQLTDKIRLGGTYVHEQHQSEDFILAGTDATFDLPFSTEVYGEYAHSETESVRHFASTDGGLNFNDNLRLTFRDKVGNAYKVEVNNDYFDNLSLGAYFRKVSRDFSTTGTSSQAGTKKMGTRLVYELGDFSTTTFSWDEVRTDPTAQYSSSLTDGKRQTTMIVQERLRKGPWQVTGEWKHEDTRESESFAPQKSNQRSDVGLEVSYDVNDSTTVFTSAQVSSIEKPNDIVRAGFRTRLDDGSQVSLTQSFGGQGDSTVLRTSKEIAEGVSQYTDYTRSHGVGQEKPDVTVSSGLRGEYNDRVSIYREEQFSTRESGDNQSRVSGVGIKLTDELTARVSYEKINQTNNAEDVKTNAVHVGLSYIDLPKVKASTDVDFHYDQKVTDYRQIASNNVLEYRFNEEYTLMNRLQFANTRDITANGTPQRYVEIQSGMAYRPIQHDWLNLLLQFKRLDDKSPAGQSDNAALFRNIEQLYQFDIAMDLFPKLTLVESFARRDRAQITATSRTDSNLYQWINRVNYDIHPLFDLIAEYRLEGLHQTDEIENGMLLQVDFKPLSFLRLGVGYNYRKYENNMTPTDNVLGQGVFFRVTGDISELDPKRVKPLFDWSSLDWNSMKVIGPIARNIEDVKENLEQEKGKMDDATFAANRDGHIIQVADARTGKQYILDPSEWTSLMSYSEMTVAKNTYGKEDAASLKVVKNDVKLAKNENTNAPGADNKAQHHTVSNEAVLAKNKRASQSGIFDPTDNA